ncbi:hypothetical protein F4811DRAFT_73291 [Daldinia bambusicola]|nr:hypothetical protein F4811DRAFT_73291 [Daldinia bambusicola]
MSRGGINSRISVLLVEYFPANLIISNQRQLASSCSLRELITRGIYDYRTMGSMYTYTVGSVLLCVLEVFQRLYGHPLLTRLFYHIKIRDMGCRSIRRRELPSRRIIPGTVEDLLLPK